jgi:hypothetical protein
VLGLAYYIVHGDLHTVIRIYVHLFGVGDRVSVSAWNIWWVMQHVRPESRPHEFLFTLGPVDVTVQILSQFGLIAVFVLILRFLHHRLQPVNLLVCARSSSLPSSWSR